MSDPILAELTGTQTNLTEVVASAHSDLKKLADEIAATAAAEKWHKGWVILRALQAKTVYAGTVPHKTIVQRRAKNSRARIARRIHRG